MNPSTTPGLAFPPLVEASLDEAMLRQLIEDWVHHADLCAVRQKGAKTVFAEESKSAVLERAVELLRTRSCRALQVEYLYEGARWTDTVFALPQGYRLVRCRHDPIA